jgi:hypothetical protein
MVEKSCTTVPAAGSWPITRVHELVDDPGPDVAKYRWSAFKVA